MTHPIRQVSKAFTLIELLAVVAVVGILAALLFPVINSARDRSEATECLSNLRSLGSVVQLYINDHDGQYPPVYDVNRVSWFSYLEPYLKVPEGVDIEDNPSILVCPTVAREFAELSGKVKMSLRWPNYSMNQEFGGPRLSSTPPPVRAIQVQSPSKKLVFSDGGFNASNPKPHLDGDAFQDYHLGGNHLLFADGHAALWKDSRSLQQDPYGMGGSQDMWDPEVRVP